MASIAGVKFGTTCDHLVRRSVDIFYDEDTENYWCRIDADIDVNDPQIVLYANDWEIKSEARVGLPDAHLIILGTALGGYGDGQYGYGGYNTGVNLRSQGQYPADETELQIKVMPVHCPKCILKDGSGQVVVDRSQ